MSIIDAVFHLFSRDHHNLQHPKTSSRRLRVEPLESRAMLSVLPGLVTLPTAPRQNVSAIISQQAQLLASNGQLNDAFGSSLASSGNTLVVGADEVNGGVGAVYVYTSNGTTWTQVAELSLPKGAVGDLFGQTVAISGNTIVVGASGANKSAGAVYVFTGSGANWSQSAILAVPGLVSGDNFGASVAISGNTVVVGESMISLGPGAAYVFNGSGAAWTETARLTASNGSFNGYLGSYFGAAVAISGNTIAVGASLINSSKGEVCVFTGPNWTQAAILTASDGVGGLVYGDSLGWSVAVSGNTIVAGAPYATVNGVSQTGAAYVFSAPAAGWANMTQTAKLSAADSAAAGDLGLSVSISGNTIVAGAWGDPIYGKLDQGAAYVFTNPGTGWAAVTGTIKLVASDGAAYDFFGTSVLVSGSLIAVGAPQYGPTPGDYDPPEGNKGTAYIFTTPTPPPAPIAVNSTAKVLAVATTAVAGSTFAVGQSVTITITFNETVTVSGTTQMLLNDGGVAKYSSGGGTSTLTFIYTVPATQKTSDLDYASTSAMTGTIKDAAGIAASLTLPSVGSDGLGSKKIIIK